MSRAFATFGVLLAGGVGIATAYVTFQPELQRQQEEREGVFQEQHHDQPNDDVISKAIISDFQEAKQQAMDTSTTGPAWKLRQMLFGKKTSQSTSGHPAVDAAVIREGGGEGKSEG